MHRTGPSTARSRIPQDGHKTDAPPDFTLSILIEPEEAQRRRRSQSTVKNPLPSTPQTRNLRCAGANTAPISVARARVLALEEAFLQAQTATVSAASSSMPSVLLKRKSTAENRRLASSAPTARAWRRALTRILSSDQPWITMSPRMLVT